MVTSQMGIMVFLIFPMPKLRMEPFLLKIKAGCAILINEKSKTNKTIVADKALFRIKVFIISIYNSYINIIIFTIYTLLFHQYFTNISPIFQQYFTNINVSCLRHVNAPLPSPAKINQSILNYLCHRHRRV